MSIGSTSYVSNDALNEWMERHVAEASSEMSSQMDITGHAGDARQELNEIKAKLADAKKNGGQIDDDVFAEVKDAQEKFGDVPGVSATLALIKEPSVPDGQEDVASTHGTGDVTRMVQLDPKDIDNWTSAIDDTVNQLSSNDQLGMIHLNSLNAQVNQAQSLAANIRDSRDKTLDAIINRIA